MISTLTEGQIGKYRQDGYLLIPNFVSPRELNTWREVLKGSLEVRGGLTLPEEMDNPFNKDEAAARGGAGEKHYIDNVFLQRVNLWMDNPAMRELILSPTIGKLACDLEGIDGIRVWHDQTLIKPPWGNPTAWHLDNPYWSFHSEHAISIWIALDDATLENGCLWFLPGSHKSSNVTNTPISQNIGALFEANPQWAALDAVPAVMKAGSCSFHNGLTAHAAGPNMTPRYRRAMTCAFMPVGATYNGQQNVLPQRLVDKLSVGDPLDDDAQNPIVYTEGMLVA